MSDATLNDERMLRASITLPRWGIWTADVCVSTDQKLSGQARISLHGLDLTGTILDGDTDRNTGWYRIVGGAGGWRKVIGAKAYRNEAGVKLATVLGDAARECGESMGSMPQEQLGPAYERHEGEAVRALDLLRPENWYVDEHGTTQLGHRTASDYPGEYVLTRPKQLGTKLLQVAAEDISELLPGATLENIEAATVRHELTPSGIRSLVWGVIEPWSDRALGAFLSLVRAELRHTDYHRILEYKINSTASGGYVDIVPMRTKMGLPNLSNIPLRPGVPGGGGVPATGSSCLVAFLDGEPTRPVIVAYDGEAANGWKPSVSRLNASSTVEIGKDASMVELAGGSQFVALANLCATNFANIKTDLTAIATAAGASSAYTPSTVAASKAKAT